MITKKMLKEILDLLQEQEKKDMKFADIMEDYLDGRTVPMLTDKIYNAFSLLASYALNDEDTDMTWIDWFIFETDYGNSPLSAFINDKEYLIDSFDSFYDFLIAWEKHKFYTYKQRSNRGRKMWVNANLEGSHEKYNLCHNCSNFDMDNFEKNCVILQDLFMINDKYGTITPVWECEHFKKIDYEK